MTSTPTTPSCLFRVFSGESNGVNTTKHFIPFALTVLNDYTQNGLNTFARDLEDALCNRRMRKCPFVFATPSLLYALQYAAKKKSNGEQDIVITCINTTTATDEQGNQVNWLNAESLVKAHNVKMRCCKDGSARCYEHEWLTTSYVTLGEGSSYARYDKRLKSKLFQLHPALGVTAEGARVRWFLAVRVLRGYGFCEEYALTDEKIALAVKIAAVFQPCKIADKDVDAPSHLLAAFLALEKRDAQDAVLAQWVAAHTRVRGAAPLPVTAGSVVAAATNTTSAPAVFAGASTAANGNVRQTEVIDLTESDDEDGDVEMTGAEHVDASEPPDRSRYRPNYPKSRDMPAQGTSPGLPSSIFTNTNRDPLPEESQFETLANLLGDKIIQKSAFNGTSTISKAEINREREEFRQWQVQSRAEYRAAKPRRGSATSVSGVTQATANLSLLSGNPQPSPRSQSRKAERTARSGSGRGRTAKGSAHPASGRKPAHQKGRVGKKGAQKAKPKVVRQK